MATEHSDASRAGLVCSTVVLVVLASRSVFATSDRAPRVKFPHVIGEHRVSGPCIVELEPVHSSGV
jgi:hypothetical protein